MHLDSALSIFGSLAIAVGLTALGALPAAAEEARCAELGASCVCSEPLNTDTYHQGSWASTGRRHYADPADSTTMECGGSSTINNWEAIRVVPKSDPAAGLPSDASIDWVMKSVNDSYDPFEIDVGAGFVSGSTRRVCQRAYVKFSKPFTGFGQTSSQGTYCGANKQQEFWFGGTTGIQLSNTGGGGNFDLWCGPFSNCPSSNELNEQYGAGGQLVLSDCQDNWCIQEICLSGDIQGGTSLTLEGTFEQVGVPQPKKTTYMRQNIGSQGSGLSGAWPITGYRECSGGGAIGSNPDVGYRLFSHVMVAAWNSDAGQTIGPAAEFGASTSGGGGALAPAAPILCQPGAPCP